MTRPAASPAPLEAAPPRETPAAPSAGAVLLAGVLALAVAMGIGRFAFTPLMPLMMRDGLIDAAGGAELATANYLGYLVGALSAARLARRPLGLLQASLAAIVVLTAAAGLGSGTVWWTALRFGAGIASAWAMVATSSWALAGLVRRRRTAWGALLYAGVGAGIALAGILAWLLAGVGARALWGAMALVALLLSAVVAVLVRGDDAPAAAPAHRRGGAGAPGGWPLVLCYGAMGFGYILPATFLPAMARALIDDPQRFGMAWPVFGLAAMASAGVAWRWLGGWPPLRTWAACHLAIGLGAALPLISRSGPAIVLAALLVGGTFMVATLIALQQARALAPEQPAPLLARMTAAFALGQIAGPLLVRLIEGQVLPLGLAATEAGSLLAAAAMLATAAWLWRLAGRPVALKRGAAAPRG